MLARGVIEPIPLILDADRIKFRVARLLGCSVLEIDAYPLHYLAAAQVQLEVDRLMHERTERQMTEQRRRVSQPRSRRR